MNADLQASLRASLRDRYLLQRELGEGGMATVFLARDLKHGRDVAIKVLEAAFGEKDAALAHCREAIAIRDPQFVIFALGWPNTEALHSYPEHQAMLAEIGLPGVAGAPVA